MMAEMKIPRVMIAAPGSGSGKTMITCGLLELLRCEGHPVSFKCGPDYIDPMFHREVLGIPSENLDLFFADAKTLQRQIASQSDEKSDGTGVYEYSGRFCFDRRRYGIL